MMMNEFRDHGTFITGVRHPPSTENRWFSTNILTNLHPPIRFQTILDPILGPKIWNRLLHIFILGRLI